MKRVILLVFLFPLFFSATNPTAGSLCDCPDDQDTIGPVDTIRKIMQKESARVDSFITSKKDIADSLRTIADSLAVELKIWERDSKKKRVLGKVDRWPAPGGIIHEWRWYYHRYRDGELLYDTVIKRTYNGIF